MRLDCYTFSVLHVLTFLSCSQRPSRTTWHIIVYCLCLFCACMCFNLKELQTNTQNILYFVRMCVFVFVSPVCVLGSHAILCSIVLPSPLLEWNQLAGKSGSGSGGGTKGFQIKWKERKGKTTQKVKVKRNQWRQKKGFTVLFGKW